MTEAQTDCFLHPSISAICLGQPKLVIEDEPTPLHLRQLRDGLTQMFIPLAVEYRFLHALWREQGTVIQRFVCQFGLLGMAFIPSAQVAA